MPSLPPHSAIHENLTTLCWIRGFSFTALVLGAGVASAVYDLQLPWSTISVVLVLILATLVYSAWRAHRQTPISPPVFFGHLLADVVLFSALLYVTGGVDNPFVAYYLVPVTIATIALPLPWAMATGLMSLLAYSALFFFGADVPALAPGHSHHLDTDSRLLSLHSMGMWLNIAVSGALILWFISRMAETIRKQEKALLAAQAADAQQRMEEEQLLAVATLAASATHDLGTPLNTMKLIVDELAQSTASDRDTALTDDLGTLATQIDRCRDTLKKLSETARVFSRQSGTCLPVKDYFDQLIDRWHLMRPEVNLHYKADPDSPDIRATFHPSLTASVHNVLHNAADVSPDNVEVDISWRENIATIDVIDRGPGLAAGNRGIGQSAKPGGLGLGLFLTRSILGRHGGEITFYGTEEGGTRARIELPLMTEEYIHD